ncbi:hypothetical protein ACOMHN_033827 [Nucella lapillus]
MAFMMQSKSWTDVFADGYDEDRGCDCRGTRQHIPPNPYGDTGNTGYGQPDQGQRGGKRRQRRRRGKSRQRQNEGGDHTEDEDSGQDQDDISEALPDVDPDEWIKIFRLLLSDFNGRTKLGTLMSKKGNLLRGFTYPQAATWLKRSRNFLVFAKQEQIKSVSVYSRKARLCFNYKAAGTDRCHNMKCPYFHVCRDFVSGTCPFDDNCGFRHSFYEGPNGDICDNTALENFDDQEIRTIAFRSAPVVCDKFSHGGCIDDCPDLHVCAKYLRKQCWDSNCKFGHVLKGTEHNDWVLSTFCMQKIFDKTLNKLIITHRNDGEEECAQDLIGAVRKLAQEKNYAATGAKGRLNQRKRTNSGADFLEAQKAATRGSGGQTKGQSVSTGGGQRQPEQKQTAGIRLLPAGLGKEGTQANRASAANHYSELCEKYVWTGSCQEGTACPRYHHPDRKPFVWQLHIYGSWCDLAPSDSVDIEERFCALAAQSQFEVVLPSIGGLLVAVDFNTMAACVSDGSDLDSPIVTDIRRWSVPSYVDITPGVTLNLYDQWLWYHKTSGRQFKPYSSGALQYTLEEKYLRGQEKYYFEDAGGKRFLAQFKEMTLADLDVGSTQPIIRRPFQSLLDHGATVPLLSSLLKSKPPTIHQTDLPAHWCTVDRFQTFELVELAPACEEYAQVRKSFWVTMPSSQVHIVHIFRVQNPSLWDKYCSAKRSMAPPGGRVEEVEERELFHGTPALLAARGICTNGFDFRRAGNNVGTRYGRGSYFSTSANYSHSYTHSPDRFMFRAKVLVGDYIKGDPSYTKPPEREGLKLYGSCVNSEGNPSIFVIFDLAQSYPNYLIQYKDAGVAAQGRVHAGPSRPATAAATASAQVTAPQMATPARTASVLNPGAMPSVTTNTPAAVGQRATSHGFFLPSAGSNAATAAGPGATSYRSSLRSSLRSASAGTPTAAKPAATMRQAPRPPVPPRTLAPAPPAPFSTASPASSGRLYVQRPSSASSRYGGPGTYSLSRNDSGDAATPMSRATSVKSLNTKKARCVVS